MAEYQVDELTRNEDGTSNLDEDGEEQDTYCSNERDKKEVETFANSRVLGLKKDFSEGNQWWLSKQVLEYYKCSELLNLDCDANDHNHLPTSSIKSNLGHLCPSTSYGVTNQRMKARLVARMELLIERASMMIMAQPCAKTSFSGATDEQQNEAYVDQKMFETWMKSSPTMRWFIFADYIDPRARNPQLTTFDVTMRMIALHPFVSSVPKHLQKLSVARVLFSEFIHFDRNQAMIWTTRECRSKKLIYAKIQSLIDNWKLVEQGMRVAAAVITSFVGLETFHAHRKGVHTRGSWSLEEENSELKWKGFDCVFGKMEFTQAFIELRDPYAVLPPIIARVESNLNLKSVEDQSSNSPRINWSDLMVQASAAHPQLLQRVCHRLRPQSVRTLSRHDHRENENVILDHEKLFALLWRCYVRLRGDLHKVHSLLEDWFDCGIEKRLKKINQRIERAGGYGIVNVKRQRATENLVVLYLSGLHHYIPELLKEYFESNENPLEGNPVIASRDLDKKENFRKDDLDDMFLNHLFSSRIILDRPHLYRWDFHLDPAAITWAYHQMEP